MTTIWPVVKGQIITLVIHTIKGDLVLKIIKTIVGLVNSRISNNSNFMEATIAMLIPVINCKWKWTQMHGTTKRMRPAMSFEFIDLSYIMTNIYEYFDNVPKMNL